MSERRLSFSLKIEALISFRKDLLSGEDRYAGSWFFFFFLRNTRRDLVCRTRVVFEDLDFDANLFS